jgi:quercetin dioxygenase-like cupin family protein
MSSTEQQVLGIGRTDLQRRDLGIPGREIVQNRVDISPEAPAFEHKHPGERIIDVLEGRWSIGSRASHRRRSTQEWCFSSRPKRSTR